LSDKAWPLEQKMIVDWKMPTDSTRVLLFERLAFETIQSANKGSESSKLTADLIKKIKDLYLHKLPDYKK